jgi:hypothetical protein
MLRGHQSTELSPQARASSGSDPGSSGHSHALSNDKGSLSQSQQALNSIGAERDLLDGEGGGAPTLKNPCMLASPNSPFHHAVVVDSSHRSPSLILKASTYKASTYNAREHELLSWLSIARPSLETTATMQRKRPEPIALPRVVKPAYTM